MTFTPSEIEELKRHVKKHVENYPDLDAMVATGALIRDRGGWYEPKTTDAFNAIVQYAKAVRTGTNGKGQVQVAQPSKRLSAIARKL